MKKNEKIGFKLLKITTEQFAILEENFNPGQEDRIGFGCSFQFKADINQRLIGVFVKVNFDQQKNTFLLTEVACHFKIESESWDEFTDTEQHKIVIPKTFITHLATITVGAARGVLHAKTEGSSYNKFTLPTINILEMITDDLVFNVPEAESLKSPAKG